jgi:hypothetical protein
MKKAAPPAPEGLVGSAKFAAHQDIKIENAEG